MTFKVIADNGNSRTVDTRSQAEEIAEDMERLGMSVEINQLKETDGGEAETHTVAAEKLAAETGKPTETFEADDKEIPKVDGLEGEPMDVDQFHQDPIGYLGSINKEFVNTIKGTPAISKRGFRFMQTELGVSTTAEVVATFDDPKGVVVHARAETPDGRFAEAHGEGYLTESDVSDNEFVRYADTRAKNRAISDLTSSGALAESELTE